MDDSTKKLSETMRSAIGGFAAGGAIDKILQEQRSLAKLTAIGGFGDDALSRAARGLPSLQVSEAMQKAMTGSTDFARFINHGRFLDDAKLHGLGLYDPLEKYGALRSKVEAAIGSIEAVTRSPYGRALEAAGKLSMFGETRYPPHLGAAIEEAMRKINAPFDYGALAHSKQIALGIDAGSFGALTRSHNWASVIGGISDTKIDALLGTGLKASQLDELRRAAGGISAAIAGLDGFGTRSGALDKMLAGMESTSAKMSLFAGSIDVLGPGSGGSLAAYEALLGGYSAREMVRHGAMRDRRERTRLYRDLDVDDGLIEGDNAATIAVLVDSGVVEGQRTRGGTITAVVEAGPVRMRIMASRPKMGAFGAIDAFENGLRAFVSAKLEAAQGPNWFKQRVPGDLVARAKDRRREAMRAGETGLPLIHYTDLGDLIAVIARRDNWAELFEAVFDRVEPLRVDLERLTANRRPTMHSRPIDPVQLCEIMLIIRRLTAWMASDGGWDTGWDADA